MRGKLMPEWHAANSCCNGMQQTHAGMPCTASTRVAMWRSGGVVEWCDVEE